MVEPALGRRERKKEETKRKIFETAIKLFADKGFEATTIDEIAEAADVAKGTFFNYFPRKESIIEFLAEEKLETVEEVAGVAEASASERLRRIFDALASAYEENADLSRTVMRSAMDRMCCPAEGGAWQRFEELSHQVIRDGQDSGEFKRGQDPNVVHGALVSCFVGSVVWWLGERAESHRHDLRNVTLCDVVRSLQSVVLDGVRAVEGA
jgi:AcrR family transcriptional regulator